MKEEEYKTAWKWLNDWFKDEYHNLTFPLTHEYKCLSFPSYVLDEQPHGTSESTEGNCQADIRWTHLSASDCICWGLVSLHVNTGCRREGLYCQAISHQLHSFSNLCLPFLFHSQHLECSLKCSNSLNWSRKENGIKHHLAPSYHVLHCLKISLYFLYWSRAVLPNVQANSKWIQYIFNSLEHAQIIQISQMM